MSAQTAACPARTVLADYGLGKLDEPNSDTISQHLETCVDCRQIVANLSADSLLDLLRQGKEPSPQPPARTPRYAAGESISNAGATVDTPSPLGGADQASRKSPTRDKSLEHVPSELADHPDYELLRELGRGGMGVVYLARNRMMDRLEVLKVVSKSLLEQPGALERFQQEIRSAAKLNHPQHRGRVQRAAAG